MTRNRATYLSIAASMSNSNLWRRLLDLSGCETLDALLDEAAIVLEHDLGVRGFIALWNADGERRVRGVDVDTRFAHRTWIGGRYTVGAIYLLVPPEDAESVDLLAQQLAPLAERLLEVEAAERRTIREDIDRVYERRIRDALLRYDWNASAVARELSVSRVRVARVARRVRRRT